MLELVLSIKINRLNARPSRVIWGRTGEFEYRYCDDYSSHSVFAAAHKGILPVFPNRKTGINPRQNAQCQFHADLLQPWGEQLYNAEKAVEIVVKKMYRGFFNLRCSG